MMLRTLVSAALLAFASGSAGATASAAAPGLPSGLVKPSLAQAGEFQAIRKPPRRPRRPPRPPAP